MLSKIRTALRLSGQLWIKDADGRCISTTVPCVLELEALFLSSLRLSQPRAYLNPACCLMPIGPTLNFAYSFLPGLAHFAATQLRLSSVTQERVTFCANFLRLPMFSRLVKPKLDFSDRGRGFLPQAPHLREPAHLPQAFNSHSAIDQNIEAPDTGRGALSSRNLLRCSGLGLVSGRPVLPRTLDRDQTLGLRSVVTSTSSSGRSTARRTSRPIMPRCEAVLHQQK
jgi:hypothetical protein